MLTVDPFRPQNVPTFRPPQRLVKSAYGRAQRIDSIDGSSIVRQALRSGIPLHWVEAYLDLLELRHEDSALPSETSVF